MKETIGLLLKKTTDIFGVSSKPTVCEAVQMMVEVDRHYGQIYQTKKQDTPDTDDGPRSG